MIHYLDGQQVQPFEGWDNVSWDLTYEGLGLQADVTIQNVVLRGEAYSYVYEHVWKNGNAYLGVPYDLHLDNLVVKGYLYDYEFDEDNQRVSCSFSKRDDIYTFLQEVSKLSFTELYEDKFLVNFRNEKCIIVPTNIEERLALLGIMTFSLSVTTYQMGLETFKVVQKQIKAIAEITVLDRSGIFSLAEAIAISLFQVTMFILISIELGKLITEIIRLFIYKRYTEKSATYRSLITSILRKFNLTLKSDLKELDHAYLPSNPEGSENSKGYPSIGDFGHNCIDLLTLFKDITGAKYVVNNGVFYAYKEDSPFWVKASKFVAKPLIEFKKYKIPTDFNATRLYKFETDLSNEHTLENYNRTTAVSVTTNKNIKTGDISLLSGYEEKTIPLSLINTYDELNVVDKSVKAILKTADGLLKILGFPAKYEKEFNKTLGGIKFSKKYHEKAYYIPLVNGAVTKNHRDLMNAKIVIQNNNIKSLVSNNFENQVIRVNIEKLPVTKNEFFYLKDNSTFKLSDGRVARFRELKWNEERQIASGVADINQVISTKLKENIYE